MRHIRVMMAVVLAPALAFAQAKPAAPHDHNAMMQQQGAAQGAGDKKSGWKELDAFHALLMSTWHPAQKDSLMMARALASQLVTAAEQWEASYGPASCDNSAARKAMPTIVGDAKAFAKVAGSNASDAAVKAALKLVHDGFELVGEPCMKAAMGGMGGMGGMGAMGAMGAMGGMMERSTGWKEFDALHAFVMSFSSAANKGDLTTVREKAGDMAKAADAWLASKGPPSCDNAEARNAMTQAVADVKAIVLLSQSQGNDDALKAVITRAHASFKPIAQPCMSGAPAKKP